MVEVDGISFEEAAKRLCVPAHLLRELTPRRYLIDRDGLLTQGMGSKLRAGVEPFARPDDEVKDWPRDDDGKPGFRLIDVVKGCKPTVLVRRPSIGSADASRSAPRRNMAPSTSAWSRPCTSTSSGPSSCREQGLVVPDADAPA